MSATYRVRQFVQAVSAWVRPTVADEALLARCLSPKAIDLFRAMPRYDQRHSLNVVRTLQKMDYDEPELLAAALLHDAGKTLAGDGNARRGGALRLWHRVAIVLLRAYRPSLLAKIGQDRPGSWRWPFYVQGTHAEVSAELARQAGCSSRTVNLIRRHEGAPEPGGDPWLLVLQTADGVN